MKLLKAYVIKTHSMRLARVDAVYNLPNNEHNEHINASIIKFLILWATIVAIL